MAQSQALPSLALLLAQSVLKATCFQELCRGEEVAGWLLFHQVLLAANAEG
jgi:hypothetical protein